MKRFIFTVAVVFSILSAVWAYAENDKDVSWEEKYQDQPIVILLYDMTLELKEDWSFITKKRIKGKVQKEEGKRYGEIPIYYNSAREEVVDVKAYTITSDGKKHKYSKIQDFQRYEGYSMYSDSMVKIITMPKVVVGSIIDYEVTKITKGLLMANQFWSSLYFGAGNAIKEYKTTVILPKELGVKYKEFNLKYKPTIEETDAAITYSWHITDIDEGEYEEFRPPPNVENIMNCVEFSSIRSWSDVSDWYYGLIKKNTIMNSEIEDKVNKLIKDKATVKDKIKAILEYLQEDFRYVSMSLGDHALEPHPTDEVFSNKYGDCKDLSLLCMAMLKIAGIDSNLALFREEFRITDPQYDLPYPPLFNHVLLEIQDKDGSFYVDPLLDGYDIGEYPKWYQAAYTFIITENGGRFGRFSIFDKKRFFKTMDSIIEIKEDGSAIIEARSLWDLDRSIELRDKWRAMSQKERDEVLQALDTYATSGGKVIDRHWENMDGTYGRIRSYVKYGRPDAYPITDDMIIISLGGYGRGYDFSKEKRECPIFYPDNGLEEESTTYIIPEGFKVTYVPKGFDLDIEFFGYKRNYELDGNKLVVKEVTKWARREIPAERYKEVQDFFNMLPRKTNQRITIRKVMNE